MSQRLDTICKYCCFAQWDDITQTGCRLNKIDQYKRVGADVLECYDEDAEFFVIKNRLCPYHRTLKWWENNQDSYEQTLKYETRLSFKIIVFLETNIDDLKKTLLSVIRQDYAPAKVDIIRPKNCTIRPKAVIDVLNKVNIPCKWQIHNQLIQHTTLQSIHYAQRSDNYNYYVSCKSGYKLPHNLFSAITNYVIDNLEQFACILLPKYSEYNGLVVPKSVHEYWYFVGDPNKNMIENIKDWECQENQQVCKKWKNIVRQ